MDEHKWVLSKWDAKNDCIRPEEPLSGANNIAPSELPLPFKRNYSKKALRLLNILAALPGISVAKNHFLVNNKKTMTIASFLQSAYSTKPRAKRANGVLRFLAKHKEHLRVAQFDRGNSLVWRKIKQIARKL